MLKILMVLMMMITLSFWFSSTPYVLILTLILSTFTSVIFIGIVNSFPWFSYVLFLIFLGGVLILFTYISSLSSNTLFTKMNLSQMVMISLSILMLLMISSWNLPDHSDFMDISMNSPMTADYIIKSFFSPAAYLIYLYLIVYLFITLVYVVFIMKVYKAPLRQTM